MEIQIIITLWLSHFHLPSWKEGWEVNCCKAFRIFSEEYAWKWHTSRKMDLFSLHAHDFQQSQKLILQTSHYFRKLNFLWSWLQILILAYCFENFRQKKELFIQYVYLDKCLDFWLSKIIYWHVGYKKRLLPWSYRVLKWQKQEGEGVMACPL